MGKPRPVLLLARELGIGGCERDLARTAIGLDRSRFEPHVGCFRPGGFRFEELIAAGIPVNTFPVESLIGVSGVSEAVAVRRYARRHGIALMHAFDAPTSIFAAPVAKSLRIPVIAVNLWFRDKIPPRLQRGLRLIDRIVDAVMVNSNAVKEHLIQDENVPAERIHLCYNGVDTAVFHPQRAPHSNLVIGSVCALRTEKRLDVLIEAFAKVRRSMPGLKLLIAGSGETLPQLKELAARSGLDGACVFEPAKSCVADWMRSIDIFVLPSETESFPNALLEAMACGCAVVASRVGGVPELIEDGRSGFLFEPGNANVLADALAKLCQESELRARLGAAAAERARECFPLSRSIDCIQALYDRLPK